VPPHFLLLLLAIGTRIPFFLDSKTRRAILALVGYEYESDTPAGVGVIS